MQRNLLERVTALATTVVVAVGAVVAPLEVLPRVRLRLTTTEASGWLLRCT